MEQEATTLDLETIEYHEILWSPMTGPGESVKVLPLEYWEILPNTPYPNSPELEEICNLENGRHLCVFHRHETLIAVPMPESIKEEGTPYEEPIRTLTRLLTMQAEERTVRSKVLDIINTDEIVSILEDNNIKLGGARIPDTYSNIAIEVVAKMVVHLAPKRVGKMIKDYTPSEEFIGPRSAADALCYEVKKLENPEIYSVDLFAFGERGLYLTQLEQIIDDKMEQWGCESDEVVHGLAQLYVDNLNTSIEEFVCAKLEDRPRTPIEYEGVLSPKCYNYSTDQLMVKSGDIPEIHKAIIASEHYYNWLKYITELTTEEEGYIPFYTAKSFCKHISQWDVAQKGALLSFCAGLADKAGVFNDIDDELDSWFASCDLN